MKMFKTLTLASLIMVGMASVAQAAVVTAVEGRVVVDRAGKQSLVASGTELLEGDRVITTGGGAVRVKFTEAQCGRAFPGNERAYQPSQSILISKANPCPAPKNVRVRTETVTDGSGFNNRSIPTGNVTPGMGGAGRAAAIAAGVIGAGLIINEINDDDDCVSGC